MPCYTRYFLNTLLSKFTYKSPLIFFGFTSPPFSPGTQKPRKDKKGGRKHKSKQPAEGEGEVEQPPEAAGGELLDLDLAAITVTLQQVG